MLQVYLSRFSTYCDEEERNMKKYFYKALKWELPSFVFIMVMSIIYDFVKTGMTGESTLLWAKLYLFLTPVILPLHALLLRWGDKKDD